MGWNWGDMVAGVLKAVGVDKPIQKAITTVTGKPCGCAARQAAMNQAGQRVKEAVMPSPPADGGDKLQ